MDNSDLLRQCLGVMQTMRDQIDQMEGMFDDEDGCIEEACNDHDELAERIQKHLAT